MNENEAGIHDKGESRDREGTSKEPLLSHPRIETYLRWRRIIHYPDVTLSTPEELLLYGADILLGPDLETDMKLTNPSETEIRDWIAANSQAAQSLDTDLGYLETAVKEAVATLTTDERARAMLRDILDRLDLSSLPSRPPSDIA